MISPSARFVAVAAIAVAALAASPSSQEKLLKDLFPPLPGYLVQDESEEPSKEDFLGLSGLPGRSFRVELAFKSERGAPSPKVLIHHYAGRLRAQGGIRLRNVFDQDTASLEGRIPGAKPVWLRLEVGGAGQEVRVLVFEEARVSRTQYPVEEDRVAGVWEVSSREIAEMPAGERAPAKSFGAALNALLQPAFAPPMGYRWLLAQDDARDGAMEPTARLYPYVTTLIAFSRSQACANCPVTPSPEGSDFVTFNVNRIPSVLTHVPFLMERDGFYLDPGAKPRRPHVLAFDEDRRLLVVGAGRPPLWQPASREAYLMGRIRYEEDRAATQQTETARLKADFEKGMQILEKVDPAAAKQTRAEYAANLAMLNARATETLKTLRDELAGLSADEKRTQARDENDRPIVTLNAAYFETARPRTAPHFIVIDLPGSAVTIYQSDCLDAFVERALPRLVELVK